MAIEEATCTVVENDGEFEIRDHAPHVLAETVVAGAFHCAGNEAFRKLFRYISGDNRSRHKVTMPASYALETLPESGRFAGHIATGPSSPDGRAAPLRLLDREELPPPQAEAGVVHLSGQLSNLRHELRSLFEAL